MEKEGRRESGIRLEAEAADFLKKNGFTILERNYTTRAGEVDIIAMEKETLCFIEVKARDISSGRNPFEAINYKKQRRIIKAAQLYLLKKKGGENIACRFDAVGVFSDGYNKPRFEIIRDAFQAN